MKKSNINFITTGKVSLALMLSMTLLACSNGVSDENHRSLAPTAQSDIKQLDEAFKNIEDESSASAALVAFENYANKKIAGGISLNESNKSKSGLFSLSESLATKLAQKEIAFRKNKLGNGRDIQAKIVTDESGNDILDISELTDQKINALDDGISSQELASIINDIATNTTTTLRLQSSPVAIVSASDIARIQDKTRDILPNLNPEHNNRISPMEALVIGYTLNTHDDGTAWDHELTSYCGPDQMTAFIQKISE